MKKLICTVAAAVVIGVWAEARAQVEWDGFLSAGYTGGRLTGGSENLLGEDTRHGFAAGVSFQLRLDDSYGLAVGARYARKGGGGTVDSTFSIPHVHNVTRAIGSADIALDYVEIPVLFVLFSDLSDRSYLRGYAGPALSILMRARLQGQVDKKPIDQDIKNEMQTVQVSGVVGAGYVYAFDWWRLALDVRYWQGVTKLTDGPDIKTREFSAALGIGIPLARE